MGHGHVVIVYSIPGYTLVLEYTTRLPPLRSSLDCNCDLPPSQPMLLASGGYILPSTGAERQRGRRSSLLFRDPRYRSRLKYRAMSERILSPRRPTFAIYKRPQKKQGGLSPRAGPLLQWMTISASRVARFLAHTILTFVFSIIHGRSSSRDGSICHLPSRMSVRSGDEDRINSSHKYRGTPEVRYIQNGTKRSLDNKPRYLPAKLPAWHYNDWYERSG